MNDLRKFKENMEKEANKQERALHQRLTDAKRKQLNAKVCQFLFTREVMNDQVFCAK